MSVSVVYNGTTYSVPQTGETGWGSLTDYLVALAGAASTSQFKQSIRTVTANTTLTATDFCVLANNTSLTLTLPTGVTGVMYAVFDRTGAGGHTVATTGGQLIDGQTSYVIAGGYGGAWFQFDGTAWKKTSVYSADQRAVDNVNATNATFSDSAIVPRGTNFKNALAGQSCTVTFSDSPLIHFDVRIGSTSGFAVNTTYTSNKFNILSDMDNLQIVPTLTFTKSASSNTVTVLNSSGSTLSVSITSRTARIASVTNWS